MKSDLHIHTFFSPCADPAMSFEAIVDAAERLGLEEIALTDHPFRRGLFDHHASLESGRWRRKSPVRLWIGAELEVAGPGRLVFDATDLPLADFIMAAPSHYNLTQRPPVADLSDPVQWADRILSDMEHVPESGARVLAHPFFVYSLVVAAPAGMRLPALTEIITAFDPARLSKLLGRLADDEVALELSPRSLVHPDLQRFLCGFYEEAHRRGVRFTIGSDAHRLANVGQVDSVVAFAESLGLGPADFWHPTARHR